MQVPRFFGAVPSTAKPQIFPLIILRCSAPTSPSAPCSNRLAKMVSLRFSLLCAGAFAASGANAFGVLQSRGLVVSSQATFSARSVAPKGETTPGASHTPPSCANPPWNVLVRRSSRGRFVAVSPVVTEVDASCLVHRNATSVFRNKQISLTQRDKRATRRTSQAVATPNPDNVQLSSRSVALHRAFIFWITSLAFDGAGQSPRGRRLRGVFF